MNPADVPSTPVDPLHAHFMGRRAWHRVPCGVPVHLRGNSASKYDGETVDLSRSGALVAVTDPQLGVGDRDGITLVQDHFPDGVELIFVASGIARNAQIVRATIQRGAHLALGCSFERLLSVGEALELGIVAGESGVEETFQPTLPSMPRPGVAMSLVVNSAVDSLVGPLALGQVTALGERTAEALLTQRVDAVVAACGREPFDFVLVVGRERVGSGRGSLVSCLPEGDGCRVRVLAEGAFPRAVRRRTQAAPAARG